MNIKKIIQAIVYIGGLYILIINCRSYIIHTIIQIFSKREYIDDFTMREQGEKNLLLLAYSILCFFWTRKTSLSVNKGGFVFWSLNWILDIIILPLSVLIMVLYYNHIEVPNMKNLSNLENVSLVGFLLAIKHVFFDIANGNLSLGPKITRKHP